jgi:hypothetical protein
MTDREILIEKVLKQIVIDVEDGDLSAITEMIENLPDRNLVSYLPESEFPLDL